MSPTPTFPLFPCTTLFRSPTLRDDLNLADEAIRSRFDLVAPEGVSDGADPAAYVEDVVADRAASRDRKSTRLNSSHRTNSYAVFCLKKKTGLICHIHTSNA